MNQNEVMHLLKMSLEGHLNLINQLDELNKLLKNIMAGKAMYIGFFCLGPTNSPFSIPAIQITDSCYVAHSEDILMRKGYEMFKKYCCG